MYEVKDADWGGHERQKKREKGERGKRGGGGRRSGSKGPARGMMGGGGGGGGISIINLLDMQGHEEQLCTSFTDVMREIIVGESRDATSYEHRKNSRNIDYHGYSPGPKSPLSVSTSPVESLNVSPDVSLSPKPSPQPPMISYHWFDFHRECKFEVYRVFYIIFIYMYM
jgi:hypothetical protein